MKLEEARRFCLDMYQELHGRDTTPSEEIRAETLVTLYNATAPAEKHKAIVAFDSNGEPSCCCPRCSNEVYPSQNYCADCGLMFDWTGEWRG